MAELKGFEALLRYIISALIIVEILFGITSNIFFGFNPVLSYTFILSTTLAEYELTQIIFLPLLIFVHWFSILIFEISMFILTFLGFNFFFFFRVLRDPEVPWQGAEVLLILLKACYDVRIVTILTLDHQ